MENPSEPRTPPEPENPSAEPEPQQQEQVENNPPQPTQIQVYPQATELKYLFRKTLTASDMTEGLLLTGNTSRYYEALPPLLRFKMINKELPVLLFTPNRQYDDMVRTTATDLRPSISLKLKPRGWDEIAARNQFREGDQIDCWWTLPFFSGTDHGNISRLMQKVINEETEE